MNRIDQKFKELKERKKKAFIAFLTAGDPNLKTTGEMVVSFEKAGVDIIELGVPFSDPLADGPTIQAASQRALQKGVTLEKILASVRKIRRKTNIPVALMTYYNPIFHYGEERFMSKARACGVDGLIVPDLPPEEASGFIKAARAQDISTVFFLAPTTSKNRVPKIVKASTGFIYYVSLTGVTGVRQSLPKDFVGDVKAVQNVTDKPVCVGFGVSNARQVKAVGKVADGVIVGSAIIKEIQKNAGKEDLVRNVTRFVRSLTRAL
ncbi:MAG: tryptophan synthase subunit alpha [Candidatus Omnitrophica bacterium]|nr:tryptophan synthase subunit alpha [Candidatus Omnitrophota bacterium]